MDWKKTLSTIAFIVILIVIAKSVIGYMNEKTLTYEQWVTAGKPTPIRWVRRYNIDQLICECEVPFTTDWDKERVYALTYCRCIQKDKATWLRYGMWGIETVSYVVRC